MTADLLALSDERDLHLQLRLNAYREGWQDGARYEYSRGYAAAVSDVKAAEHGIVRALSQERNPWHLCCGPCRRRGHRNGCTRCEERTRETFSQPHPDDYRGGAA